MAFLGFDVEADIAQSVENLAYMVFMFFECFQVDEPVVDVGGTEAF